MRNSPLSKLLIKTLEGTKPFKGKRRIVQGTWLVNDVNRPGLLSHNDPASTATPGDPVGDKSGGAHHRTHPMKSRKRRFSALISLLSRR